MEKPSIRIIGGTPSERAELRSRLQSDGYLPALEPAPGEPDDPHTGNVAGAAGSRAGLLRVLDTVFAFVGTISTDGVLLYCNLPPLSVAGLTSEEVIGHPLVDAPWWAHSAGMREVLRQTLSRAASGEPVRRDLTMRLSESRTIVIDTQFAPLHDEQGRVVEIVASAVDVTSSRAAEEALGIVHGRLERAQSGVRMGSWELSSTTGQGWWSRGMYRLFEMEEVDTPPSFDEFLERVHPDDRGVLSKLWDDPDRPGEIRQVEYRLHPDIAPERWLRSTLRTVANDDGSISLFGTTQDVTDLVETERILRERERHLDLALAAAGMGTWAWDPDRDATIDWDDRTYAILGVRREDFVPTLDSLLELIDPRDREATAGAFMVPDASPLESVRIAEFRVGGSGDSVRWIRAKGRWLHDPDRSSTRVLGVVRDITREKLAAEAVAESERRYRALVEHSTDGAIIVDAESTVRYSSPAADRLFGRPLTDSRALDLIPEEELPAAMARQALALSAPHGTAEGEVRVRDAAGRLRDARIHVTNLFDDPAIRGFVLNFHEITDAKRIERQLQQQAAMLNLANVLARDGSDRIVYWNAGAERLYGWTRDEALGRVSHALLQTRFSKPLRDIRRDLFRTGHWTGTLAHRRMDGSYVDVASEWVLYRGANGEVEAILETINDITEQKRIEAALRETTRQLAFVSRRVLEVQESERRHLARELHDEIGQVMSAVSVHLKLLSKKTEPASRTSIDDAISIVDRSIDQIRSLSLELRPAMLDDFGLEAAIDWYATRIAGPAGLTVHLSFGDIGDRIIGEVRNTCFRIVQEALTNVVRHACASQVWIELARKDDVVIAAIRDDGKGFDVLTACERAARGGSIGLLGMQERARLLGGSLGIVSAPRRGTTITARVPLEPAGLPAEPADAGRA